MVVTSNAFWRCFAIILGFLGVMGVGGCATLVGGGGEQTVRINSTPPGAAVRLDGHEYGITPTMAKLSRKESHLVQLELAGYQPTETRLEKSLNPWIFGNILFGGLIGIVVDAATGSINELKPDEVQSTFTAKVQSAGNSKELSLHVEMQRVTATRVQWMQQFFASGQRELGPPAMQE